MKDQDINTCHTLFRLETTSLTKVSLTFLLYNSLLQTLTGQKKKKEKNQKKREFCFLSLINIFLHGVNNRVIVVNSSKQKTISCFFRSRNPEALSYTPCLCMKSVRLRNLSDPYFPALGLNMERYVGEPGKLRIRTLFMQYLKIPLFVKNCDR